MHVVSSMGQINLEFLINKVHMYIQHICVIYVFFRKTMRVYVCITKFNIKYLFDWYQS